MKQHQTDIPTPSDRASRGFLLIDGDDRIVSVSDRVPACGNGPLAVGVDLREALSPMVFENEGLLRALETVRAGDAPQTVAGVSCRGDDAIDAYREFTLTAMGDSGGVLVEVRDVVVERAERESIANARRFSEDVLRSLRSGLAVVDATGRLILSNEAAASILGRRAGDLHGIELADLIGPEQAEELLAGDPVCDLGQYELAYGLPDGQKIQLGYTVAPLTEQSGRRVGLIVHFRDVTELSRIKQQMMHQEKMAAIGSLAGGVAHEFNNLIGGMMGYAQLAQATRELKDYEKCIRVVNEATGRAREIVASLLSFARRPDGLSQPVTISELVDQTLVLVERSLTKLGIRVKRNEEFFGAIVVDASRLQVVILNLVANARDSMPDGGTLTIRSWRTDEAVRFSVEDSGTGIDEANPYRVFEPFYTTKGAIGGSTVPGSGLGLWVSYGIVRGLGGEIEVETGEDGTRFTVSIPLPEEVGDDEPERDAKSAVIRRGEKALNVLVQDPDLHVRRNLVDTLRHLGARAIPVETWKAALDYSQYGSFELVFCAVPPEGESPEEADRRGLFEIENPDARVVERPIGSTNGTKRRVLTADVVRVLEEVATQRRGHGAMNETQYEVER